MGLDRRLGQVQPAGDLRIAEPETHRGQDFPLPCGEQIPPGWRRRPRLRRRRHEEVDQPPHQPRRDRRVPGRRGPHRVQQFLRAGVLRRKPDAPARSDAIRLSSLSKVVSMTTRGASGSAASTDSRTARDGTCAATVCTTTGTARSAGSEIRSNVS